MPTNSLTDAQIKRAVPTERPYKLFDGGGLYLYVTAKGAKVWRVAYRLDGKQQTQSFGPYPETTLAQARAKRDELRGKVRAGDDPRKRTIKESLTVQAVCVAYWDGRKDLSADYVSNALRAMESHVYPSIGDKPVGAVTRDDVMALLDVMNARGRFVYLRKTRMWLAQAFDYAVERGHMAANPAAGIRTEKAFGKRAVEHFAALRLDEVHEFWRRLAIESELQSVLACRLLAYTWLRTTEVRMLRWSEVGSSSLTIPADRMKRRRDHVVPLSTQAREVLHQLRQRSWGGEYVFPSDHRIDRPISENAVLYLLARMGYGGRMTGHGWRTVASTWANERGYSPDAIERQLAHAPDDAVRAAYNRAEYMPERAKMLQAWADWLTTPGTT